MSDIKKVLLILCLLVVLVGCEGSPPVKHEGWARVVSKEYIPSGTTWEYTFKPDGTWGPKLSSYPAEYHLKLNTDLFGTVDVEIDKDLWDRLESGAKVYLVAYTVDNRINDAKVYLEQPK